jgi:TATA-box binding protein (TBP) (component of TFIID and TFIIIB)
MLRQGVEQAFDSPVNEGEIVNVNITSSIGIEIDPMKIAEEFEWAEAGQGEGFCQLSFDDVPGYVKLYNTGTVVLVGVTDKDEVLRLIDHTHTKLRGIGIPTEHHELDVTNMVVKFSMPNGDDGSLLNLPAINIAVDEIEYEPEHFAGAIYRAASGKTCLLFNTGRTVVQGSTSTREAVKQKEQLFDRLDEYGLLD